MDLVDLANGVRRSTAVGSISSFFCFELFQPAGGPGGAEVAGTTIPGRGHVPVPLQTAHVGAIQIDGIESLPQSHRRSRLSCIRGTLVKKTGRGYIAGLSLTLKRDRQSGFQFDP